MCDLDNGDVAPLAGQLTKSVSTKLAISAQNTALSLDSCGDASAKTRTRLWTTISFLDSVFTCIFSKSSRGRPGHVAFRRRSAEAVVAVCAESHQLPI